MAATTWTGIGKRAVEGDLICLFFIEQLHRGHVDPRYGARNRRLEILCQAAVSIEPSEGSFDDPSPWQQLKASSVNGAFDDLDSPVTDPGKGLLQTGAVVDAVGKEVAQPGKPLVDPQ